MQKEWETKQAKSTEKAPQQPLLLLLSGDPFSGSRRRNSRQDPNKITDWSRKKEREEGVQNKRTKVRSIESKYDKCLII